ncbi:MAG: MATE family efflux transporter [Panacagrimonas sp.]
MRLLFSNLPALLGEARANFRLAAPLIAAQLSFVSMGTVDTILAGRLGASELAAVAVGSNAWFLSLVMFMGLTMAVSPIVAQRVGAQQSPERIGRFLRGALLLSLLLGLLWFVLVQLAAAPVLGLLQLDQRTNGLAEPYMRALAFSTLPFSLAFVLRNGAEGHGLTQAPLIAGVVGALVNAGMAWVLMYGRLGAPAMGPVGAGWATVIAAWAMVGCYASLYVVTPKLRALRLFGRMRIERETFEIFRVGLPISAIVTAEAWLFCIGALMMARFGPDVVAAHQIAINFASLAFMIPLSIGMATTVRVGHAAGAGDWRGVALRGRTGIAMGACFALMSASLMALVPAAIVAVYTDVQAVAAVSARFLIYAAIFQIFDCIQATSNGALRGIKDTRLPMAITLFAYWAVGMPVAAGLAFGTTAGPVGVWYGFIAGLAVAAAGLSWRFFRRTRARAPYLSGKGV